MIKTLHITGAAAVVLAVVVVASVFGYLRPASLLHLSFAAPGDKQIEGILGGSSAVDRFKEQHKGKVPEGDATPPLVKQAELFADIINPKAPLEIATAVPPTNMPPKPSFAKPSGPVSTKFDLLGTCYSPNPKTSFAYIRLPDNTFQWVGQGSEIGHVTLKEIRKGSIVCWDGTRNVEMTVEATPETSSLLETGKAPATPATTPLPRPTVGGKAANSPVKPPVASIRPVVPGTPAPSAQISKEEQQALGDLGNRLKAGTGADTAQRSVAADKLIAEYKSARVGTQEGENLGDPNSPSTKEKDAAKDSSREESRRQFMKRFSKPRSMVK